MGSILYTHRQIVNTPNLREEARKSKSFREYSRTVAKKAKRLPIPVLYVDGTPTTEQFGRLLNDRLIFLVCLFPPSASIEKLTELSKVFSSQPWYLNLNKIKVYQLDGCMMTHTNPVTKETTEVFDFRTAQMHALQEIDKLLNTQEGQILAAAKCRIVPEGQPDTWAQSGGGFTTKLQGAPADQETNLGVAGQSIAEIRAGMNQGVGGKSAVEIQSGMSEGEPQDETEYLLSTPANAEHLRHQIDELRRKPIRGLDGKFIKMDQASFKKEDGE
ncbi:hypothetical protein Peetri_00070 [Pseudomonas phage vB_PpuM-Peetri]